MHGRSVGGGIMRWGCVAITVLFVGLFLLLPLASIFYEALKPVRAVSGDGGGGMMMGDAPDPSLPATALGRYWEALTDPNSLHAMKMTLLVTVLAVPLNTIFGVAAAWAIAKFDFRGKRCLPRSSMCRSRCHR